MKIVVAIFAAVAAMIPYVTSHSYDWGNCPDIQAMDNFDPDQFSGLWYIIEIFGATSRCMMMIFNRTSTGFDVLKSRELFIGRVFGIDHTFGYEGSFTINNPAKPSEMQARWDGNFLPVPIEAKVMDTDYNTYAMIFTCQYAYAFNRHSLVIMSRTPELAAEIVQTLKASLPQGEVDVSDFDKINHDGCNEMGKGDFNFNFNQDTFGFLGIGDDPEAGANPDAEANPATANTGFEIPVADEGLNEVF